MRFENLTNRDIVRWFDSRSVKPYDPVFQYPEPAAGPLPEIPGILELNRDAEPFLIQAAATETPLMHRCTYEPLTFVHFSDIHAVTELWNRIAEYIDHYKDYIAFGIHTGDYCGDNQDQWHDLYAEGRSCARPILNCVGNHDTVRGPQWEKMPKEEAWKHLFTHTDDWGARFLACPHSMSYFRDFPDSNLRLIVLDLYYDLENQKQWLRELLTDARQKGLCVITAMHEPSAEIVNVPNVTFHTLTKYGDLPETPFESVLKAFIAEGGNYICNFCGHEHHDLFGYTAGGVLNVAVECACDWAGWCDGMRVRGTRTYDCFNVVSIDTDLHVLKLVRVGNNVDYYLRKKQVLCYDYQNRNVIFNG